MNNISSYGDVVSDPSPKRRRLIQKRVVKVPIKEIDGSHFNKHGEYCTNPPSDSWAWRKYGQKPIKGSPFPRGYYRCSSSKGCPARKQVERSQSDPTMLLINYSYDHNHSFPVNSRTQGKSPIVATRVQTIDEPPKQIDDLETMITPDEFPWLFSEFETSSNSTILDGSDLGGYFPMREDDESLFADLGELPECSVVFGTTVAEEENRLGYNLWCRTSG